MKEIIREVVTYDGPTSSSRIINILGAITATVLVLYHGIWLDSLNADVFGVYLAYCAGVYAGGKYLDRRYKDDRDISRHNERYEEPGYNGSNRGIDNPDA